MKYFPNTPFETVMETVRISYRVETEFWNYRIYKITRLNNQKLLHKFIFTRKKKYTFLYLTRMHHFNKQVYKHNFNVAEKSEYRGFGIKVTETRQGLFWKQKDAFPKTNFVSMSWF